MNLSWFLLIIILFTSVRVYGRWIGYHRLLTNSVKGSPFDVPRDWDWKPMVTFMIPSFNEGKVVCESIESIMASDYPKDKIEICAVDDNSQDDTWKWIQAMAAKYPDNVVAWKNTPNKGKPFTLIDIARRARGELVFTVDSDTIIAPDALKQIVSCYADPEIGGVCGFVRIKNLNDSLWTQMQGTLFASFYWLTKTLENQTRTSRCMCGPLASFRTPIFLECVRLIEGRQFLGVNPIQCGEDAYLTTRITLGSGITKRWKVFNNFDAVSWTANPSSTKAYLNQQLRWWRGSMLTGSFVLVTLFKNSQKAGVIPTVITTVTVLGIVFMFLMLVYFWMTGYFLETLAYTLLILPFMSMGYCLMYNRLIGRHDKVAGELKNPMLTGFAIAIFSIVSWIPLSIISLFTMDDGGWITRQNGSSNVS